MVVLVRTRIGLSANSWVSARVLRGGRLTGTARDVLRRLGGPARSYQVLVVTRRRSGKSAVLPGYRPFGNHPHAAQRRLRLAAPRHTARRRQIVNVYSARERAARGDRDEALPLMRAAVLKGISGRNFSPIADSTPAP